MLNFKVDQELCIQCGNCAQVCPSKIINMPAYPEMGNEHHCMRCLHCLAVCPTGAISILGRAARDCPEPDLADPGRLKAMIHARRSMRFYEQRDVPANTMNDLLSVAACAPTGVNVQELQFTVISSLEKMNEFRLAVYKIMADTFDRDPELRKARQYPILNPSVRSYASTGLDRLFCNAPHLLVVTATPKAICANEDCIIALSYFELYAASLGLGTLWNGFFAWVMRTFPGILPLLGIPEDHHLGYAMCFGLPGMKYARGVTRERAQVKLIG